MLENVLFFIKILIIAISARRCVIRLQRLLCFWLKLPFITQQFLLVGIQGLVLSPDAWYSRYATDIHTILVFEKCALYNYIELNKPRFAAEFYQEYFPKTTSTLAGSFVVTLTC